jgi:hypothetical protein
VCVFRPLPLELIQYARSDTHYLLHIFDRMWNEALTRDQMKKNILLAIINRSKELCYKKYEKESFQSDGWRKLYNKTCVSFTPAQVRFSHFPLVFVTTFNYFTHNFHTNSLNIFCNFFWHLMMTI